MSSVLYIQGQFTTINLLVTFLAIRFCHLCDTLISTIPFLSVQLSASQIIVFYQDRQQATGMCVIIVYAKDCMQRGYSVCNLPSNPIASSTDESDKYWSVSNNTSHFVVISLCILQLNENNDHQMTRLKSFSIQIHTSVVFVSSELLKESRSHDVRVCM